MHILKHFVTNLLMFFNRYLNTLGQSLAKKKLTITSAIEIYKTITTKREKKITNK